MLARERVYIAKARTLLLGNWNSLIPKKLYGYFVTGINCRKKSKALTLSKKDTLVSLATPYLPFLDWALNNTRHNNRYI